ncbi:hypothetical protein [Microbacterium sp. SSM24]|uniref:hypothetical protein n=1 Tax=Microbacterium sp. SSM24 TaxID=2991714 RepID=UPI002227A688|nr:hypothetical protein [Microbacterium sp. SSM24]MCW3494332.1 hypothetical protein [Microbacterium sp. SSM24]
MTDTPTIAPPKIPSGVPVRLLEAAPSLWRVVDRRGVVIGHLQALAKGGAIQYRARRFHATSRAFLDLGDFWSLSDALDCLRFAR